MPIRLLMASTVSRPASTVPTAKPTSSTSIELKARCGMVPLRTSVTSACTVALNVGTSSGLSSQRP